VAYSASLAARWAEVGPTGGGDRLDSVSPAAVTLGQLTDSLGAGLVLAEAPAAVMLLRALVLWPAMVPALLEACDVKLDSGEWPGLLRERVFAGADVSPLQQRLQAIYCQRSASLFKPKETLGWVNAGAACLVAMLAQLPAEDSEKLLARAAAVRAQVLSDVPKSYRTVLLSEFSDALSSLPPDEMPAMGGAAGIPAEYVVGNPDASPLLAFFETLFPGALHSQTQPEEPQ